MASDFQIGDALVENNGDTWDVVVIHKGSLLLEDPLSGVLEVVPPEDFVKYAKKEPVFEVGKTYRRTGDPTIYTVIYLEGDEVAVKWKEHITLRATFLHRSERQYFTEVK